MSGTLIHQASIAVDYWRIKKCENIKFFFLTHMHADHCEGLTPSWTQPIYCSPMTKELLLNKIQFTKENIVHELELNVEHILHISPNETINVTLFNANHCPGAVMFLFEGTFGRILHTGDFRYAGVMQYDEAFIDKCTKPNKIDLLYIDNTFLDPRCTFPSQNDAISIIVSIIQKNPDAAVKIGLRTLGKENMLIALARYLNQHIGVDENRYKILEIIRSPSVFSVSASCQIQVVDVRDINNKNMESWNRERRTIAIIPSGLGLALGRDHFCSHKDVHVVPYSDHCSFQELIDFVKFVEPRKVLPILGPNLKDRLSIQLPRRSDIYYFQGLVSSPSETNVKAQVSSQPAPVPNSDTECLKRNSPFDLTPSTSKKRFKCSRRTIKRVFGFKKAALRRGVKYTGQESSLEPEHEMGSSHDVTPGVEIHCSTSERCHPSNVCESCSSSLTCQNCLQASNDYSFTGSLSDVFSMFAVNDDNLQSSLDRSRSSLMSAIEPLLQEEARRLRVENCTVKSKTKLSIT